MKVTEKGVDLDIFLQSICRSLVSLDPRILALVQFGSSVYAPELARDVDLLVVTEGEMTMWDYEEALGELPLEVDIIVHRPGDKLSGPMGWGVKAAGRLLYGDPEIIERMVVGVPVPTFEQARLMLLNADRYVEIARGEANPFQKDGHFRTAFNALFDVARLAVMAYLGTEETRWGSLRRELPRRFATRFKEIVDRLHIDFFYHSSYPSPPEKEFRRWRKVVVKFIDDLEAECQGGERR